MAHEQCTRVAGFSYPLYNELPDGLLFARDLVEYVNRIHEPLGNHVRRGKTFTIAMATNYVKGGLTPPAIGRRYNRDHLALILFAATAKLCFSAEEVYWLAERLFADDVATAHDAFALAVNDALAGKPTSGREGAIAHALISRMKALAD